MGISMLIREKRISFGVLCGCLLAFLGCAVNAQSQKTASQEWTWMGGNSALPTGCSAGPSICETPPVYGVLGTPASSNTPGGRVGSSSWTDKSGNLWLFGGALSDTAGDSVYLNDLWRYNPTANEWTWMGGSNSQGPCVAWYGSKTCGASGVYGTRGTASSQNFPGGRFSASQWQDSAGNFWLFGGFGVDGNAQFGSLNDLWMYSPSTDEWTWISGSNTLGLCSYVNCGQAGVYGTLGSPAAGNGPGGRNGASAWADPSGNLWLLGGEGFDSAGTWSYLNDLWMFKPTTGDWEWVAGSSTSPLSVLNCSGCVPGARGLYGTQGTFASESMPGGRDGASAWLDGAGNLWLFGGIGYDSAQSLGELNDLWEFKPSLGEWAWMGGTSTLPEPDLYVVGDYGNLGTSSSTNIPGSRSDAAFWTDSSGKLWLFGGYLIDRFSYNDLWMYDPSTSEWTWMGGSNISPQTSNYGPAGVYGQLGTPSSSNVPGARRSGNAWVDGNGDSWLYGGEATDSAGVDGLLNDLWAYQPYPNAASPSFSVAGGTYPTSQTVTLSDSTSGSTIYYTTNGTAPTIGSTQYTGPILVAASETVEAIAIADGYTASAVVSAAYMIPPSFSLTVNPGSVSVKAGQSGSTTIAVQEEGGFNGSISFACSGLPAGDTCSFTTLTVPTQAGVSYTTLTVDTSSTSGALNRRGEGFGPAAALTALLCCFSLQKRRRWLMLVLLAAGVVGLGASSGCGGGGSGSGGGGGGGTQPVTSTITVTGTSGSLQSSTTFTLTVN